MYSRKICEKCRLTCFADSEEKLENMIKDYHCKCESEEEEKIPEYIGKRRLRSSSNIYLAIDDYETNS